MPIGQLTGAIETTLITDCPYTATVCDEWRRRP